MISKDTALQKIDDDLIWRKKELSQMKSLISQAVPAQRDPLIRASICLLYAHWEGFIKCAATNYLSYVCNQGKKASELKPNFVAIKFLSHLHEAAKSAKPSTLGDIVGFISEKWDTRLRINYKNSIHTHSNLSSTILKEILWTIGLDMAPFETKFHLIDTSLVNRRNHIAHGDFLDIKVDEYNELHENTMALIETFRTELQNSITFDTHLKPENFPNL